MCDSFSNILPTNMSRCCENCLEEDNKRQIQRSKLIANNSGSRGYLINSSRPLLRCLHVTSHLVQQTENTICPQKDHTLKTHTLDHPKFMMVKTFFEVGFLVFPIWQQHQWTSGSIKMGSHGDSICFRNFISLKQLFLLSHSYCASGIINTFKHIFGWNQSGLAKQDFE